MLESRIKFASQKLLDEFRSLEKKDIELYRWINNAIVILEKNAYAGTHIKKALIPKEYISKYDVHNLWKFNLPKGWRLIYSVGHDEVIVICLIIEWFDHKNYERRFKY